MTDRTDIDALLIGALYGELTPADEARLTAHLESHPADRTALDDLTRTRAAVRESRILAFHAEPPAAVSALLMQEASRRAPRPEPGEGWFQRFVRTFAAHPAMAAAATLVLVLGVAGTLYLRGADQFAAPSMPVSATEHESDSAARQVAEEKAAPAMAPESPAAPAATADPQAAPGAAAAGGGAAGAVATGAAAGSAGYRVDLDVHSRDQGAAGNLEGDLRAKAQPSDEPADGLGGRRAGFEVGGKVDHADLAKAKSEVPAKRAAPVRGIELRRPEPSPKELKDSDDDAQFAKERTRVQKLDREAAQNQVDRKQASDDRFAPSPPPPPPPPAAVAPADQGPSPAQAAAPAPSAAPSNDAKRPAKPPGNALNNAASAAGAPSAPAANQGRSTTNQPAPKSAPTNLVSGNATASDKSAESALQAWARGKRDQVVALVNANNCDGAAEAAMEIYNRAPGYFSSTILTDREVKPCLVYVNRQRARIERARAAKNANSADTEAPSRK